LATVLVIVQKCLIIKQAAGHDEKRDPVPASARYGPLDGQAVAMSMICATAKERLQTE